MEQNKISEGEQLRIAILDYSNARLTNLLQGLILLLSILSFLVFVLLSDNTSNPFFEDLINFFAFFAGISILFVFSTQFNAHIEFKKIIRLLGDGACHLSVGQEDKFFLLEFFIPANKMVNIYSFIESDITKIINALVPQYSSRKYKHQIEFYAMPSLVLQGKDSPIAEFEKQVEAEINRSSGHLPSELKSKGNQMSKAYLMLFCIENTLRLFIENTQSATSTPLFLNSNVKKKIQDRKNNEMINKYISVRGDSDLFYLDFKELGDVIINNPEIMKKFPSENWVKVKIEELGNIRNLVAHNSYIGDLELRIIATNYHSILRQIE